MGLTADMIIPDFEFEVLNAEEVLRAMAETQLAATKDRFKRGQGVDGALPRGKKTEGRPLVESGQLENSIAIRYSKIGQKTFAEIRPEGERTELPARMKARLRRLAKKRGAAKRAFKAQDVGELGDVNPFIAAALFSAELKKELKTVRVKRIRAKSNMDVAAILNYEPKDKRAKNGGRGVYNFWWYARGELEAVRDSARRVARVALVESGGARHEGRPE